MLKFFACNQVYHFVPDNVEFADKISVYVPVVLMNNIAKLKCFFINSGLNIMLTYSISMNSKKLDIKTCDLRNCNCDMKNRFLKQKRCLSMMTATNKSVSAKIQAQQQFFSACQKNIDLAQHPWKCLNSFITADTFCAPKDALSEYFKFVKILCRQFQSCRLLLSLKWVDPAMFEAFKVLHGTII